ncbi:MAG: OsmC family protein [Parachlamydia sp.]|nr:OsmC family protein [Parachlamydia sp.]
MVATKTINGIDTGAFEETCTMIKSKSEMGKARFRVNNKWNSGGNNNSAVQGYYAAGQELKHASSLHYTADEPPLLLGTDKGANPVEYLLTALSSCMTSAMVYHAAARGYKIESMDSHFEGELDMRGFLGLSKDVPMGYQKIVAEFKVKSDAPEKELVDMYHYSPVYSMVSPAVPIEVKITKI